MDQINFDIIGIIHSCFTEKFGIPRQPGLTQIPSTLVMNPGYNDREAFRELESFSHIWIVFVFHGTMNEGWKPTVRPPRLGGNQKVGVFASRSMFRPNPIGLSVVELKSINTTDRGIELEIVGGDFLDQTPVLDIKPYLPYADAIADSKSGYALHAPQGKLSITFSETACSQLLQYDEHQALEKIIIEILQLDPRPAYQQTQNSRDYAMRLFEYDIHWQVDNDTAIVTSIEKK